MKNVAIIFTSTLLMLVFYSVWSCAGSANPTGKWNFGIYESSVSGVCPMGHDGSGSLAISSKGGGVYVLRYVTGMSCKPKDVCMLKGKCSGDTCVFSTKVKVDSEGGIVLNSAELRFDGASAQGSGQSVYSHPSGMKCTWSYMLSLNKN